MSEQRFIRKSHKLLRAARALFGNKAVVDAWVSTYHYDFDDEREALNRLDQESKDVSFNGKQLDLDVKTYYIKMENGNVLEFTNSEWGAVKIVNEKDLTLK